MYFLCKLYVVSKKPFKYSDDVESRTVGISHWIVVSQSIAISVSACCVIADDVFCAVKQLGTVVQLKIHKGNHC